MEIEASGGSLQSRVGDAAEMGGGRLRRKAAAALPRTVSGTRARTGMQALMILILVLSGCSSRPLTSVRVAPPTAVLRGASGGGRAPRFLHTRVQHHTNAGSTWNVTRVIVSGDVELNPGPPAPSDAAGSGPTSARTAPGIPNRQLSCLAQNVRSLKNKLSTLRAVSPVLQQHDIVAFTETWLKPQVGDSELSHGFSNHIWFRRDQETEAAGGGVACAVRASLLPTRRSEAEPVGSEVLVID